VLVPDTPVVCPPGPETPVLSVISPMTNHFLSPVHDFLDLLPVEGGMHSKGKDLLLSASTSEDIAPLVTQST
jgi:hypothetical protein